MLKVQSIFLKVKIIVQLIQNMIQKVKNIFKEVQIVIVVCESVLRKGRIFIQKGKGVML